MRFPPLTPVVRALLAIFLVAYVAQLVSDNWLGGRLAELLMLSVPASGPTVANGWQIGTYVLAQNTSPQGVTGFLLSAVFFWLVVSPFEQLYGRKNLIRCLVMSLFGGSLPAFAVGAFFLPGYVYGFSTLTLGCFMAWAWSMRTLRQRANFFGVWEMSPTTMMLVVLGLALIQFLASGNWLHLIADLGATGAGVLFIELLSRPSAGGGPRTRKGSGPRKNPHGLRVVKGGKDDDPPKWLN
ncbi:MAG: hypothetical protein KF901_24395 [Myxococcales bacterium]|nr:hypothetical protein [Myxococcales bacterium]